VKILTINLLLAFSILSGESLSFGVVPQQSPEVLAKKWVPIAREISQKTGLKVVFKTEASIPKFEEKLYSGEYDLAYMNPYHFVVANKRQNYRAIARSTKNIKGIVVSKMGGEVLRRETLLGKNFLFPAPNAFAATLLTKYELNKIFDIDIDRDAKVLYVNSHDSVYKGVSRGLGSFGGGIIRTYKNLSDKRTKSGLDIGYITDDYPSHPIGIHPRVDKKSAEILEEAILNISPKKLKKLNIPSLKKISNSEYLPVKELAIKLNIYE
jgi:phosphonate transport system substrate-binding protein